MTATEQPENWGELGPAMRALNERQRLFVRALLLEKPGYGSATRAYRKAGYGPTSKAATQSKEAHKMLRDDRIIAGIAEESKKVIRGIGHAEAVSALLNMIRHPEHRDHARAVDMIMRRVDPEVNKYTVDVTHHVADPDREALEELRAAPPSSAPHATSCSNCTGRMVWTASRPWKPQTQHAVLRGQGRRGQGESSTRPQWLTTMHRTPRGC